MAYGIEIDNSSGVLQIDETHLNLGLVSSGTATCNTAFGGASRLYSTTITKSTGVTYPVIAIHTYGNAIALTRVSISGSSASWTFAGGQNDDFIYYIFDKYPASTTGYGLQVFDSSGNVTFNSDYPPMSVKAFGTTNTNNLSSGPVYAAIIEAPSYSQSYLELSPTLYVFTSRFQGVVTSSTGAQTFSMISETYQTSSSGVEIPSTTRNIGVIDVTNMGTQPSGASYAISPSTTTVNEGSGVTFTVTTSNVSDGTTLYWTTTGDTVAADFTDTSTSGTVTINSNTGSIVRTLDNDTTSEGAEVFALQLRTGSTSGTIVATSAYVTVNDTSTGTATYSLSAPTSIDEGSAGTVNVTTTSIFDGTILYWKVEPTADFSTTQGTVTITSNAGSFSVTPTADNTTEGAETGTVRLYTDSARTNQVATDTFTINDTSQDPPDYTPAVTGTWSNLSDTTNGDADTGNVTLSDINQTINLYWTNAGGDSDLITVQYSVNGGAFTTLAEGSSNTVAITNGQTLGWRVTTTQSTNQTGTITIKNGSDSDATVGNTFTYTLAVAADVTPNAVNWGDCVDTVNGIGTNSNQTISGITSSINLYWVRSGDANITVSYSKNNGSYTTIAQNTNFSVSNNDTIKWQVQTFSGTAQSGTITVRNASDSNASLDTFNYNVRLFFDGGGF
jgi:hypothetical protein